MDIGSIIFVLVIVLVCVVPIVLFQINQKKKEKRSLLILKSTADINNATISEYDLWYNFLIGIDKTTHKLFFIRKTETEEVAKAIDLAEIIGCKSLNKSRSVSYRGGNQLVVERIELVLSNRDKNKPDIILEFYNSATDNPVMRNEIQLVEKWSGIVNKLLSESIK
ncbi:MAG: hypothetical protein WCP85_09340 [Mariniphaga sp.]